MLFVRVKATGLVAVAASIFLSLAPASASVSRHSMPITFEQNKGQAANGVNFISRSASGVLFLSQNEITLSAPANAAQFKLKLSGVNPATHIVGSGESSGTVNYFHGQQSSEWLTNIPSYTQVTYQNVYPNIDLVVYGNSGQFESDFVIRQGADPSAIAFQIDGDLEVRQDGSLAVKSAGGAFRLHRPFVYQLTANGERSAVDSRYSVGKGNQISFALGRYDHAKPLVIDPVLTYSTYLGGSASEEILSIGGDLLGNVYVTGDTTSLDFPNSKKLQAGEAGGLDCFVAKFDPTGQKLLYSTYLGGSGNDSCRSISVNLLGEAFVGGITASTNFPTRNAIQSAPKGTPGNNNGFVAHLDCTGSKLIFSTYLGGGGEFLTGVAVDLASNVYATGITNSPNYPVTSGAYQTACGGACLDNAFLSKISPDGSKLIYSTYLGGSTNYDSANGVAVDLTGSAYVVGEAHSTDFPTTKSSYQPKLAGASNAFVTKFSADGSTLVYSTFIGGANFDSGRNIALDIFGNAYIAGVTNSTNFPTVNPFQAQYNGTGSPNMFVLKLNNKGTALNYSSYIGGSQYNYAFDISVDIFGNASVAGETTSKDFPVKAAIQPTFGGGNLDAVVVSVSPAGALNYSTYLGGASDDYGFSIYSDPFGCIWVGGVTYSTNFPVLNPYQAKSAGGGDAFLTRISQ